LFELSKTVEYDGFEYVLGAFARGVSLRLRNDDGRKPDSQ
jgi:hypothetical protein